jgi:hypothetical protein
MAGDDIRWAAIAAAAARFSGMEIIGVGFGLVSSSPGTPGERKSGP